MTNRVQIFRNISGVHHRPGRDRREPGRPRRRGCTSRLRSRGSGDVAWIFPGFGTIGRTGGEQEDQSISVADQMLLDGGHRLSGAFAWRTPGEDRPGLGQGVDPAFRGRGRSQGRSVVEVAAAIPAAVPTGRLDGRRQETSASSPFPLRGRSRSATRASAIGANRRRTTIRNHGDEQLSFFPRSPVHAVVPVSAADQRQAVRASGEDPVERGRNVRRAEAPASSGRAVIVFSTGGQERGLEERDVFVRTPASPVVST